MNLNHDWLLQRLDIDDRAPGVFGVCYSILTMPAMSRGCAGSVGGFGHSFMKIMESGHATTFLWVRSTDMFVKTLADHSGWGFFQQDWAKQTPSATTYVYYIEVDHEFIERYKQVARRLIGLDNIRYSHVRPNVCTSYDYVNCVSSSHRLMAELGLVNRWMDRGFWTPNTANWVSWISTFSPKRVGAYTWKYRVFPTTNTLVWGFPHGWLSQDCVESISPNQTGSVAVTLALS